MTNALKLNFTFPADVANDLKEQIDKNKRSAFVADAVKTRLKELKKARLQKELAEGYQARNQENEQLNRDWEHATLEKWD